MGYQVLARKWRPHTFHQVVGQQHVLTALINALEQGRLHHAYLFSGTRGVGKTTIARILAKCLNCEQGVTSTPCGQCDSCREIDQGNFVDLLEIDAASRTKVEDTRELLDNVQYRPARGRYKVYLIDEVHMLSRHSFNALLKTLEEPPPYVKFLLATTDPQKLPVTILSRCLQFHLKALNREQIIEQLARVLDAEGQAYEPPALMALAKAADGSMRDALSLTDQALAHGNGQVHLAQVLAMLGTLDHRHLHQMLHQLQQLDGPGLMAKVAEVSQLGPDFELLHAELASLLHRVALAQLLGRGLDPLALDNEQLQELARLFTAEEIQLYYQIALTGRKELPYAPDGRSGLEMTLLRMLAFSPRRAPASAQLRPVGALSAGEAVGSRLVVESQPVASQGRDPATISQLASASPAPTETMPTPMREAVVSAAEPERMLPEEEALFAEQQALIDQAAALVLGDEPPAVEPGAGRVNSASAVAMVVEKAASPAEAQPESGISQLLMVRNRLRSQQKETTDGASVVAPPPTTSAARSLRPPLAATPPRSAAQASASPASSHAPVTPGPSFAPAQPAALADNGPSPVPHDEPWDMPPWELPPLAAYQDEWDSQAGNRVELAVTPATAMVPQPQATIVTRPALDHPSKPVVAAATVTLSAQGAADAEARWNSNDLLTGCGDAWGELIAACQLGGRLRQLALHAARRVDGGRWVLTLPAEQRHLLSDKAVQSLSETFASYLQQAVQVEVELGQPGLTPAQIEQQRYAQLRVEAEQALAQDPHIQFLIQRFGAQLDADSILPLKH